MLATFTAFLAAQLLLITVAGIGDGSFGAAQCAEQCATRSSSIWMATLECDLERLFPRHAGQVHSARRQRQHGLRDGLGLAVATALASVSMRDETAFGQAALVSRAATQPIAT
jgi:hypothetical protein